MRRTLRVLLLNVSGESPSFRSKPGLRNLLLDVSQSPYKEQFKDYWATPVPFAQREFGPKPRLGDPVPTRAAATTVVVGKNCHIDPAKVAAGEDNDYKVLMVFREAKGRYIRDQFVLPSQPMILEDRSEKWERLLQRCGLVTQWPDLHDRLAAMRALMVGTNLLLIPKEGGSIAEVEGPPGPHHWHWICYHNNYAFRDLVDILELPMESTLGQMLPFRRIITPTNETFRFDNRFYLVPVERIADVRYTTAMVGERLVWVSPMEAMARFNAGIMNMPTPNLIALSELHNACPTFADVVARTSRDEPRAVLPELYRHGQHKVATVVLPGDVRHSATTPEDRAARHVRRFVYEKDIPWGVRAVFDERPATEEELQTPLVAEAPAVLEAATEADRIYESIPYLQEQRQLTATSSSSSSSNNTMNNDEEDIIGAGQMAAFPFPQLSLRDEVYVSAGDKASNTNKKMKQHPPKEQAMQLPTDGEPNER